MCVVAFCCDRGSLCHGESSHMQHTSGSHCFRRFPRWRQHTKWRAASDNVPLSASLKVCCFITVSVSQHKAVGLAFLDSQCSRWIWSKQEGQLLPLRTVRGSSARSIACKGRESVACVVTRPWRTTSTSSRASRAKPSSGGTLTNSRWVAHVIMLRDSSGDVWECVLYARIWCAVRVCVKHSVGLCVRVFERACESVQWVWPCENKDWVWLRREHAQWVNMTVWM